MSLGVAAYDARTELVRAASGNADVRTSNGDVVQASAPAPVTAENLVVSSVRVNTGFTHAPAAIFCSGSVVSGGESGARGENGGGAVPRLLSGSCRSSGTIVRATDVDLGDSGEWRRVLVGEFATEVDARVQMNRVQQTPAFVDAQVIRY